MKAHETIEETLALSKREFVKRCLKWNEEFNGGKKIKVKNPMDCPVAQWVVFNDAKCNKELVAGTVECLVCGHPMCPDCMNHKVEIISRVTGYLSTVSGWNESKKQEFKDRQRYESKPR